jgi:hypothetical protein
VVVSIGSYDSATNGIDCEAVCAPIDARADDHLEEHVRRAMLR